MLSFLWIFRNFELFKSVFNNSESNHVRQLVIRRGWHHFNMQAIVYVAGLAAFNSLEIPEITAYLGLGFFLFTALIYINTQRNIKFSEKLHGC